MKVGAICPIPHLSQFGQGNYHLILSHLFSEPAYFNHYRDRARSGDFITLDNSAYEFGASVPNAQELLMQAIDIGARELVVPDVIRDAGETARLAFNSLTYYAEQLDLLERHNIQLMLVPQGKSIYEWGESFRNLIDFHHTMFPGRKFSVGIPKHTTEWPGGREGLLRRFVQSFIRARGFDVHLLGMGDNILEVSIIAMHHPYVRSIDSVKPFTYAAANLRFPDGYDITPDNPGRYPAYFQTKLSPNQVMIANYNLANLIHRAETV